MHILRGKCINWLTDGVRGWIRLLPKVFFPSFKWEDREKYVEDLNQQWKEPKLLEIDCGLQVPQKVLLLHIYCPIWAQAKIWTIISFLTVYLSLMMKSLSFIRNRDVPSQQLSSFALSLFPWNMDESTKRFFDSPRNMLQ